MRRLLDIDCLLFVFFCRKFWLPKMSSTGNGSSSAGPMSPDILNFDDSGGGGGAGPQKHQKVSEKVKPPQNLDLTVQESMPILLITANVGSIFDDPPNLVSQWLAQVCQQIRTTKPAFVAIHCQEVSTCGRYFRVSRSADLKINIFCLILLKTNIQCLQKYFLVSPWFQIMRATEYACKDPFSANAVFEVIKVL